MQASLNKVKDSLYSFGWVVEEEGCNKQLQLGGKSNCVCVCVLIS